MVKIFSGDDTDFKGDQRLALTFAAPDVDFTGCTAEIEFLGQRRTFAQVTDGGRLAFSFSADETRGMRCGVWPVTIRLRDASGRVRTVDNTQRIKVTSDVNEAYADAEQELSVALRSGGVALPEIPAELNVEASDSVGDFKRKYNGLLELLRRVAAIAVAVLLPFAVNAAGVATAPLNEIPGTAQIVTNVTFDGLARAEDIAPGMTTNAVCAIVTNVVELDEWTLSGDVVTGVTYTVDLHGWWYDEDTGDAYDEPGDGRYWEGEIVLNSSDGSIGGPEFEWPDATSHTFDMYRYEGEEIVEVGRITATRRHVVQNALGLARLEDMPSTNGFVTADGVRDIVTNVTVTPAGDWVVDEDRTSWDSDITVSESPSWNGSNWVAEFYDCDMYRTYTAAGGFDALELNFVVNGWGGAYADIWYTRHPGSVRNTLGLARLEDVPDTSGIAASVSTLWTYVYGGSVWIAVTNYMRTVAGVAPSFQLWEVRDGATNCVYSSAEEIDTRTGRTNLESQVAGVVAAMPDRAWSKYQSATGNESPEGVTIVSTPIIQLTGGGEWYRYVDVSSNSVWFLRSNGVHTFGGDTNGYFRILDDEGNPTFEVRKTDSYTVDAVPESIHFDGDGNFCISFQSNIQPMIYTSPSLSVPAFSGEGEDPNITVTWSHAGGVYTATVEQTVKSASLFAYAKIEVQGTTVIRNTAPTDVSGGILCTDGIHKCRPRYTNGAITWEVVP